MKFKWNNKEKLTFWWVILIGVGGGILGNLLVGSALDIANNRYKIGNSAIFVITTIVLVLVLCFVRKQIKCILKN